MDHFDEQRWPVDLDQVRLWPMESEDGALLQELLDDLVDFRTAFGRPSAADLLVRLALAPQSWEPIWEPTESNLVGRWRPEANRADGSKPASLRGRLY